MINFNWIGALEGVALVAAVIGYIWGAFAILDALDSHYRTRRFMMPVYWLLVFGPVAFFIGEFVIWH